MQLSQWCMNSQESGFTGVPWPSHPAVCISVKSRIIGWYISQCTENYSWFYLVYLFIPVYNSPIVLTVLTRFWVGVSSLSGLFRVERKRRRLRGTRSTPEYMCFCVLPMETVCAAVLFLSRSSNVLPIGSANPDFFLSFPTQRPHDYLLSMLNNVNNKDLSEHNLHCSAGVSCEVCEGQQSL